ncbi:hypothetical protein D3C87_1878630 [compost metagenome]
MPHSGSPFTLEAGHPLLTVQGDIRQAISLIRSIPPHHTRTDDRRQSGRLHRCPRSTRLDFQHLQVKYTDPVILLVRTGLRRLSGGPLHQS